MSILEKSISLLVVKSYHNYKEHDSVSFIYATGVSGPIFFWNYAEGRGSTTVGFASNAHLSAPSPEMLFF